MKPNIKRAVDKKELSTLDGRIISEIITAIDNCNQRLLSSILANYKIKSDEDIWLELQKYNIEFDKFNESVEQNKDKKKVLVVDGLETYTIPINSIFTIETQESFDDQNNEKIYQIIINRDETGKMFHCNTVWTFFTQQQRDYSFNKTLKLLEIYRIVLL